MWGRRLFGLIRVDTAAIRAVVGEDGKGVLNLQNIPVSFLLGSETLLVYRQILFEIWVKYLIYGFWSISPE